MTTTRTYNRAPKGGTTINGRFFRGGCFTPAPVAPVAPVVVESRWIVRPVTLNGVRGFRPIAVVNGLEIVSGPMVGTPATVDAARAWIARVYDGGRTFPNPHRTTMDVAGTDAIRSRYRTA